MAEQTSNANPSLGFTLKVASTAAGLSAGVVVAEVESLGWSGADAESVDVTTSLSADDSGNLVFRSKAGRIRYGSISVAGKLVLSAALTGNHDTNMLIPFQARAQKYWRITFSAGGTFDFSGFVKSPGFDLGSSGAEQVTFDIELDGKYFKKTLV